MREQDEYKYPEYNMDTVMIAIPIYLIYNLFIMVVILGGI